MIAYKLVLLYFFVFISDNFGQSAKIDTAQSELLTSHSQLQHNHDQFEILKNYFESKKFFNQACDRVAAFPFDKFPANTPENLQRLLLAVRYALLEEASADYLFALKYDAQSQTKLLPFPILMDKISSCKLSGKRLMDLATSIDQYVAEEITLDDYRLQFKNIILNQLNANEEECVHKISEGRLPDQ